MFPGGRADLLKAFGERTCGSLTLEGQGTVGREERLDRSTKRGPELNLARDRTLGHLGGLTGVEQEAVG